MPPLLKQLVTKVPGDPIEYHNVSKLLTDEIDYKNNKVEQFSIRDYYRANKHSETLPMYAQHGLKNYTELELGDNRLRIERSFSHDAFDPENEMPDPDAALPEEHKRANRYKMYEYARMHAGGSVDKIVDTLEETIKEKLKIRSQISLYQFLECFKHFCPHGRKGIRLHEIRDFFMMMGISVNESQIIALYAKYDTELTGEIDYRFFIEKLQEKDFVEVKKSWVLEKGHDKIAPTTLKERQHAADKMVRINKLKGPRGRKEMGELLRIWNFADNESSGRLPRLQLESFLSVAVPNCHGGPEQAANDIDEMVNGAVSYSFEDFWTWYTKVYIPEQT